MINIFICPDSITIFTSIPSFNKNNGEGLLGFSISSTSTKCYIIPVVLNSKWQTEIKIDQVWYTPQNLERCVQNVKDLILNVSAKK